MYQDIATTQLGLVAYRQLIAAGLSRREVEVRAGRGDLELVRRSVYRVRGTPILDEHPILAAALAAGDGATVSDRGAAKLHRLDGFVCRQPELTVVGRRPRLAGVRVRRVNELADWRRTVMHGVPVTTVAQTFVDLSTSREPEALGRSIDNARRRGLVRYADILQAAEGRPQMQALYEVLSRRLHDKSDTDRDSFRRVRLRRAGWIVLETTTAWTLDEIVEETAAALIERGWRAA